MTQRDVETPVETPVETDDETDDETGGAGPPGDPGRNGGQNGGDASRSAGNAERPEDTGAHPAPQEPARVAELEDRWRRAVADLDNLRKRHSRELPLERAAERARVAAAFLPVIDNIDLALQHADAAPGAIVEGVRAIREQALAVLAHLGYPRQDEVGRSFDPHRHEVVAVVPVEEGSEPGSVVEVVRPGYGGAEQPLRPAAVTVARDPEN
ncbi:MAG TPA: nucleotide exchange factor GrpE [Actinomycetospora sp.]|nr:nucleotide exchange factor GrpE [Actinomycetospora sp.]